MIDEKDKLEQKAMEDAKGGIPYEAPKLNDIDVKAGAGCGHGDQNAGTGGCSIGNTNTGDGGCKTGSGNTASGFSDIDVVPRKTAL